MERSALSLSHPPIFITRERDSVHEYFGDAPGRERIRARLGDTRTEGAHLTGVASPVGFTAWHGVGRILGTRLVRVAGSCRRCGRRLRVDPPARPPLPATFRQPGDA